VLKKVDVSYPSTSCTVDTQNPYSTRNKEGTISMAKTASSISIEQVDRKV